MNYSVLEALATKTLVISNDIVGVSEIIKNKVNGLLIKNNNHQNYFDSVMQLEANLSKKYKMQNNGFENVRKYNRKLFLSSYKRFINNL